MNYTLTVRSNHSELLDEVLPLAQKHLDILEFEVYREKTSVLLDLKLKRQPFWGYILDSLKDLGPCRIEDSMGYVSHTHE